MKAFISYSHHDEGMLERLHKHLAMLIRENKISAWFDREIVAGATIDGEIDRQLESCDLFLALVSPDFLHSHYCYEREMSRAIERHKAGDLVIVPVIVEPCDWQSSPLGKLKAVPKDGKAVSLWSNENEAFLDVVNELRGLVKLFREKSPAGPKRQPVGQTSLAQPKYRVKKAFDPIDRAEYRGETFQTIREFFEMSCMEIDGTDGIRGRYESMGPNAFTCTIVNKQLKGGGNGTAYITVRAGESSFLGDISWSFTQHAGPNTANGGFSIECDDYHQFMRGSFFSSGDERRKWYAKEAAHYLWQVFIEQAGISL